MNERIEMLLHDENITKQFKTKQKYILSKEQFIRFFDGQFAPYTQKSIV